MVLNIKRDIIDNPERFNQIMNARNFSITADEVIDLYNKYKSLKLDFENTSMELNQLSKNFTPENRNKCEALSEKKAALAKSFKDQEEQLNKLLYSIPNLFAEDVPIGKNEEENQILGYFGVKPEFQNAQHHEEIANRLGFFHREEAVEMSGSRFVILSGALAKLERRLAQFALDFLEKEGFEELSIPLIVKEEAMKNTGQLSKFTADEFFAFEGRCLIPTGETALVNYFYNKTVSKEHKVVTLSPCFRKESGSLGRDTKGLIRLHQFYKVEMVAVTSPETSKNMHESLLKNVCTILDKLGLHYRTLKLCSGDMGFTAFKQYDIEVWMPGQGKYVEVASCSNCGDYQARRMGLKFNNTYAHTLNSTALACGRIIAAILENYCQEKFVIPVILEEYFKNILK